MLGNVAIKRQWLMDFTYYMLAYISIHGHADKTDHSKTSTPKMEGKSDSYYFA
jgi:hypothetical protein